MPYFHIKRERALTILAEVERSVAAWRDERRALGWMDRELDDFADAFDASQASRGAEAALAVGAYPFARMGM